MWLTISLSEGGMILVFSTHTINLSLFKLFVRLYVTVILFFLASTMIESLNGVTHSSIGNNHITNNIIKDSNGNKRNYKYKRYYTLVSYHTELLSLTIR